MPTIVPPADDGGTLLDLLHRNADMFGSSVAAVDVGRRWTWQDYRAEASTLALALLDLGVEHGDRVGIMLPNRAEHVLVDSGALLAGATPTSFYATLATDQLEHVARDSGCAVAVVGAELLDTWLELRHNLPALRHLIVVDAGTGPLPHGVLRYEELAPASHGLNDDDATRLAIASANVAPDDPATIVYTSGTTGPPKGTLVTHRGVRFVMDAVAARIEASDPRGRFASMVSGGQVRIHVGLSAVSYLPLAHLAERLFTYYLGISHAMTVTYCRDMGDLREALVEARPQVFLAVPRVWEKFHDAVSEEVAASSAPRRAMGRLALATASRVGAAATDGRQPPLPARVAHRLFERTVYGPLRRKVGLDRCLLAVSGAAPITADLLGFYHGLGISIIEGYGMTESSAVISLNPFDAPRIGTVGTPLEGVEVRLGDDGEILSRGPHVTPGYLNRPDATAETIDDDGWLHTGDVGALDDDGYLCITGRKKELIINAAGKNMSPANIEQSIANASPILGPCCVIGDRRPYLTALLTLDPDALPAWADARGIDITEVGAATVRDDRIVAEVERAVAQGNERLSRVERVKRWRLLDHAWTIEGGIITPSLKLKRDAVHGRYTDEIESLYQP